ncbi:hypothetical protein MED15_02794 [Micromonospora noduli]|uniref:Uncharacterized protein n=1 Tax=Micromonospora noduli TaxID=709876 RepID=A0ABX9D3J0_9ACTN|nr:hypothetical protein [Micromonospora noduli]RAO19635.1 hypothetical protein MED15_02794 [Micromonospora noduli]
MDTIDRLLGEADQAWRGYGVGSADRAALAADLRLDLRAAAADGGDPAQLIGGDVAGFARRLADEAGVRRVRGDYGRILGTALIGAVLGVVLGYGLLMAAYPAFVRMIDIPARSTYRSSSPSPSTTAYRPPWSSRERSSRYGPGYATCPGSGGRLS